MNDVEFFGIMAAIFISPRMSEKNALACAGVCVVIQIVCLYGKFAA